MIWRDNGMPIVHQPAKEQCNRLNKLNHTWLRARYAINISRYIYLCIYFLAYSARTRSQYKKGKQATTTTMTDDRSELDCACVRVQRRMLMRENSWSHIDKKRNNIACAAFFFKT